MDNKFSSRQSAQQKGGIARSKRLAPAKRSEIASQAAQARWSRSASNADLSKIEDLEMNMDAIDAADMLVTELNEQVALLSQSGANALASGHIAEAKMIIDAIEKSQNFCNRAAQLKSDITEFHSKFTPDISENSNDQVGGAFSEYVDESGRKQDRTDPVLMNKKRHKILSQLEERYGARLHRRSAALYRSDSNEIGIVCTMSKWHSKNENYWYAYHPHQDQFLAAVKRGYFVLGMMDSEAAVALPVDVIRQNLEKLNTTTTPDGRRYWHIHISRSRNGGLSLQRARGEAPLALDRFIVNLSS